MARIDVVSVTKRFETGDSTVTALDDVSLAVQAREIVTLVGASGCGKSTLLNLVAGFETPTTGQVLVDGQPIKGPGPDRGVVFQQTALFPWLSVEDNIVFGLRLRPFGALDSLTRSIMQDFLLEIWEEQRKTVVLVTHDIDEAIYLADKTVVMTAHPGRICEVIDVDLPRPRRYEMRSEAPFIVLRDHVTAIVRTEAIKSSALSAVN